MELSKTGRVLRVYAILSLAMDIKKECENHIFSINKTVFKGKIISYAIDGIEFDLDKGRPLSNLDDYEEPNEDSRYGWTNPLKIGKASNNHHRRVKYNQRRNLRSTTPKR